MHTDEAVHAVKFGTLLEKGDYKYDPFEYHGPTLNYFTLVPAWLSSKVRFAEVNETILRIVPVLFSIILMLATFLLFDGLGKSTVYFAAMLTAVSPAMSFYSRYYIQEILLVCFTFCTIVSFYRYTKSRKLDWAVSTGIFAGLMYSTKETCAIAFASMVLSLLIIQFDKIKQPATFWKNINKSHILAAILSFLFVAITFYSSFFTNFDGVLDSVLSYRIYFTRAAESEHHIHPWYYYLKMLIVSAYGSGPVWSEFFILLLAIVGIYFSFRKKSRDVSDFHLIRFITVYTIILLVVYSLIPYKTPWNMLTFLHGLILLAGFGITIIFAYMGSKTLKAFVGILIFVGVSHLAWQSVLANYKYFDDPANPYVYAHTLSDINQVVQQVEKISSEHPDQHGMPIEVIFPGDDYWPLPWYLRAYPNVGWWNHVSLKTPPAPLILASPEVETDLLNKLYTLPPPGERSLYVPLVEKYTELRPDVEIRGYVAKELWDRIN